MKRLLFMLAGTLLSLLLLALGISSADEEKPLGPGWMSLDSSVGMLDRRSPTARDRWKRR